MALGKKQSANNADFVRLIRDIETIVSRKYAEDLVAQTAERIRRETAGQSVAFAWSGGKDSLALQVVAEAAGIRRCVLVITDLEYPEFLAWTTNNMPAGLEVVNTGQDLDWLVKNPGMLFPQTAAVAGKWFKAVQHTGQERYYRKHGLDAILLGRRRIDGNFVGRNGENRYTSRGFTRYSPIADWSHEDVVAVNFYFRQPCPPMYGWPNGFVVGSGPWAARQYTGSVENGWREVFQIDPNVVKRAASRIPSAAAFLSQQG